MNSLSLTCLNHRVNTVIMIRSMFVQMNKQIYLNLVHILLLMSTQNQKTVKLGGRK